MAFANICISMAFILVTLASSSRGGFKLSVDTLADIVLAVKEHVRSGCLFFLCPESSGKLYISF